MAKILVVDDDQLILESLTDILQVETKGYEILQATDGQAGLKLALDEHPDLIIADMRMPKMTGGEMIAAIRKDHWGKKVPIIVMSNDENTGTINAALTAGVTVYLSKINVDRAGLLQQINTALS